MDTDSFVYHIKTEDFYKDISADVKNRFDTSAYKSGTRPLEAGLNKKVIGLMKDELSGEIMTEFVALRSKLYAFRKIDGKENKRCKGIKKCVAKQTLTFEDYKNCLFGGGDIYRSQLRFQNTKHEIFTAEVNKVALNRNDDKRFICGDRISTYSLGHYRIEK